MMSNFIGRPKPGHGYCGNIFLHTVHTYIICWIWPKWESCIGWLTDVESCLLSLTVRLSQHSSRDGGLGLCRLPWPVLVGCRRRKELSSTLSSSKAQGNDRQQHPTQLLDIGETSDFFGLKSKFYKKRGATFFYDITRKLGPLDFTQYRSKSSSF